MASPTDVLALLEKFGRTVQVRADASTPTDPSKPWRGNSTGVAVDATAVILAYTKKEIDGQLVKHGDMKALVDPTIPLADMRSYDVLIDQGETWNILSIETVNPGQDLLLYKLQLRR